jgi:hypothetical protein
MQTSDILRNKYCVIGASQSGKTTFVIDKLLPTIAYDSILLCGADHNLTVYEKASKILDSTVKRRRRVVYLGFHADSVLKSLRDINQKLRGHKKETLVIFDDFIDPKAVRSQPFLEFIATCRHSRITVIFICHSVDVVISAFMKTNMTHFIVCQYAPSRNFSEFMATFLDPLITDQHLLQSGNTLPTPSMIRETRDRLIAAAFSGRYGKLIIHVTGRRYAVVRPIRGIGGIGDPETSPEEATKSA